MYQIEYSALKYYNNVISEECLYIGILFNNLSTGKQEFSYIHNFKRFQAFDDEADVGFVKRYLEGMKYQIEKQTNAEFSIADYSKLFVNEFRFTIPIQMEVEEQEDYVDNLTKVLLKFDIKPEKRLSILEEKRYIRRILAASNADFSANKVYGQYDENVTFDYVIGNIAIKLFSFKEKDALKLIPFAKQWAFSAEELKDRYKVVFLYDDSDDTPNIKIVMKILKKYGEVFRIQEGIEHVLNEIS